MRKSYQPVLGVIIFRYV